MSIFISIAAYRDAQLAPTVRDCLDKARHPERLRFGICWQHADDEQLPEWFAGGQFAIVDVDYRDSRGACWARAQVAHLWDDAQWYLQLDSHHRFVRDWDEVLLDEMARTASERPVLTTYAPHFDVDKPLPAHQDPMSMQFRGFNSNGMPMFMPRPITDSQHRTRPHRARFVSGHFLFAPRRFLRDIPCDPDVYFGGEEITLSVRAFTHGYDLFEPSHVILWHEYSRAYRRKHWDDHLGDEGIAWHERDEATRRRIRRLFDEPHFGRFGFGTERTLRDYEAYAGISFRHRKVQDYTRRNLEPPNPAATEDWPSSVQRHCVEISVGQSQACDATGWTLTLHDDTGDEIHSQSFGQPGVADGPAASPHTAVRAEFECQARPATWKLLCHNGAHTMSGVIDDANIVDLYARRPDRVPGLTWTVTGDHYVAGVPGATSRTHELNSTGALLVELADGNHSIRDIAALLKHEHQLDDDPVAAILDFYEDARIAGLIELRPARPTPEPRRATP